MNNLETTLAQASDNELIDEALDRGLVLGVETRDIVELMCGVKHNNPKMIRDVVVRLARVHLGKII